MGGTKASGRNITNLSLLTGIFTLGMIVSVMGMFLTFNRTTEVFTERDEFLIGTEYGTTVKRDIQRVETITKPSQYSTIGSWGMFIGGLFAIASGKQLFDDLFPPSEEEIARLNLERRTKKMGRRVNNPMDVYHSTYRIFKSQFPANVSEIKALEAFVAHLDANKLFWDEDEDFKPFPEIPEEQREPQEEAENTKKSRNHLPITPPAAKKNTSRSGESSWEIEAGKRIEQVLNRVALKAPNRQVKFTGTVVESGIAYRFLFDTHADIDLSKLTKFDTINIQAALKLKDQKVLMTQRFPLAVDVIKKVPGKVCIEDWVKPHMSGLRTNVPIGQDLNKELIYHDFAADNSSATFLVGAQGSGKTITLQSMLFSLAANNDPNLLQISLFDFKTLHYLTVNTFPWLHSEVGNAGTDPEGVVSQFQEIIREMEWRESNLDEGSIKKHNANHPENQLPVILVVVDELDETFTKIRDATGVDILTEFLVPIAKRGRSLGIPLFCGCQTFHSDLFPQDLRRVVDCISLKAKNERGSQQAIGTNDAAHLCGHGHGLRPCATGLEQFQSFYSEPSFLTDYLGINVKAEEEEEVEFPEEENNEEQEND